MLTKKNKKRKTSMAETSAPTAVADNPSESTSIAIDIQNFSAFYDDFQAIHDLSLSILDKKVMAFIGPSGCGKSTLLKWINRMNDVVPSAHSKGKILVGDLNVLDRQTDVVDLRRRVGMVFQKPNPFPKSIYDNVAFGARLHYKISKAELDNLVEWSLKKAAIWNEVKDRLNKPANGLSGGQKQRLCIARAIAVGPEILLMDEPCSALDPGATAKIESLIYELSEQYTIVIVTHNMQQASRCSDRTAFFYEGRIVESGPTKDLFTRPKEKQTEDYVSGKFG